MVKLGAVVAATALVAALSLQPAQAGDRNHWGGNGWGNGHHHHGYGHGSAWRWAAPALVGGAVLGALTYPYYAPYTAPYVQPHTGYGAAYEAPYTGYSVPYQGRWCQGIYGSYWC